uniref:Uncharacterized protein n=1 Tax=Calcidiscus leptoporus TaxID=127549 RepID=A0A7S0NXD9_9EUKA
MVSSQERSLSQAMRRALAASPLPSEAFSPGHAAKPAAAHVERGWLVRDGDGLEALLCSLRGGAPLLALHEDGVGLDTLLTRGPSAVCGEGVVLVLGDHKGYSAEDEALLDKLGARRGSVGPLPLLTSQCIVLCHHALDCRAHARAQASSGRAFGCVDVGSRVARAVRCCAPLDDWRRGEG